MLCFARIVLFLSPLAPKQVNKDALFAHSSIFFPTLSGTESRDGRRKGLDSGAPSGGSP